LRFRQIFGPAREARGPCLLNLRVGQHRYRTSRTRRRVEGKGDGMRIGSIVIHCYEFERMMEFWQAALHYVPRAPASGGWVVLQDPAGRCPNLSLQARDRRAGKRSWLHLDLYTDDREREVKRLVAIGARRYPWRYQADADFVVLEDPDGNLFCVVQKNESPRGAA
jgi:catechol 2,3-dioxygenase-like lactoylglutathione lyase family enzyme